MVSWAPLRFLVKTIVETQTAATLYPARRQHPGMLSLGVEATVTVPYSLLLCSVVKDPTTKKLSIASHVYKVQAKVSHV